MLFIIIINSSENNSKMATDQALLHINIFGYYPRLHFLTITLKK
jgi:hypothetical protein